LHLCADSAQSLLDISLFGNFINIYLKPGQKMNKDSFLFEFLKSGPFRLLLILAILILVGILISNHHKAMVQMKENVLYVAPAPIK
jgi:hypothetical protein